MVNLRKGEKENYISGLLFLMMLIKLL